MTASRWRKLFLDPSALPNVVKLNFALGFNYDALFNYKPITEALAATVILSTNQPRPL